VLLHKQLDPDDEEITRTRKVRRGVINRRYAAIIDALYADVDHIEVTTTVTYQDGSTAQRHVTLRIQAMDGIAPPPLDRSAALAL
jgi:long-chain acyl-CoA synthetase